MALFEIKNLSKTYSSGIISRVNTNAVKNVSFELNEGQLIALVGESGSGKSTIAKMLLKLEKPSSGEIELNGQNIFCLLYTSPSPRDATLSRMPSSA